MIKLLKQQYLNTKLPNKTIIMKKAKIRFGTWLFVLFFIIMVVLLSLLTKNKGDMPKTIADISSLFGK